MQGRQQTMGMVATPQRHWKLGTLLGDHESLLDTGASACLIVTDPRLLTYWLLSISSFCILFGGPGFQQ